MVIAAVVLVGAALSAAAVSTALGSGYLAAIGVSLATLAALEIAGLPLGLAGHRASRQHGLSRQSRRSWLADRAKGIVFGAVLLAVAGPAVIWLQRTFPDGWPLATAAAAIGVELVLALVFPVLILPRFLRSEPLADGPLRAMALATSDRARVPVVDVRLLRLGEKTRAGNAMVVGLGPTRRILLGDTLAGVDGAPGDADVDGSRLAETAAVLAHELAHHRNRDVARGIALGLATTPVTLLLAAAILSVLPAALAHGGAGDPAVLPALGLAIAIGGVPSSLTSAWHSRRRERAADAFACAITEPLALARAFARLAADGLAELDPPRLGRALASHPPLGERIRSCDADVATP